MVRRRLTSRWRAIRRGKDLRVLSCIATLQPPGTLSGTMLDSLTSSVTDMACSPHERLLTRSVGDATTPLGYTPYGAVASITDPDNVITRFTYDAAHRFTTITDALGNVLQYTLDAADVPPLSVAERFRVRDYFNCFA